MPPGLKYLGPITVTMNFGPEPPRAPCEASACSHCGACAACFDFHGDIVAAYVDRVGQLPACTDETCPFIQRRHTNVSKA